MKVKTKNTDFARRTIFGVIVVAMLAVFVYTIFSIIATPEFLIKREIESIATDYYENYFYPNIQKNHSLNSEEPSLADVLDKYASTGFPRLTLNQLLLYDNRKHYASFDTISQYCDVNKTIIKIFPESPFTSKNYRIEYNYSCNF